MKKRKLRRRNPVARAVRRLRPQVVPSAKAYKRRPKHKRPFRNQPEWPFFFFYVPVRANARPRLLRPFRNQPEWPFSFFMPAFWD